MRESEEQGTRERERSVEEKNEFLRPILRFFTSSFSPFFRPRPRPHQLFSLSTSPQKNATQPINPPLPHKGLIVFDIDGTKWALELRPGKEKKVTKGAPEDKPDVTLVIADADFAKLVGGASPQTMFLTRKLKIQGSMAVALKTQSILAAARPKAKL